MFWYIYNNYNNKHNSTYSIKKKKWYILIQCIIYANSHITSYKS